jgi:hypothetical protein
VRINGRHGAAAAEICCRAPTPRYAEPCAAASSASGAKPRVEHGTVGMLDQHERCHGFERRDLYFLTFAAPSWWDSVIVAAGLTER